LTRSDYADGVRKYLALILEATQKVDIDAISHSKILRFLIVYLIIPSTAKPFYRTGAGH
jgi:hypothetical protein